MESHDLSDPELAPFTHIIEDVVGLFTPEDLQQLAEEVPPNSAALITLFEHTWAVGLKEAIADAGGHLLLSERVSSEALEELNQELAATRDETPVGGNGR
jgi:hypothetical protein